MPFFVPEVLFVGVAPGAISGSLHLPFWVTVYFSVMVLWVKSISEGEVVLNL